MLSESLRQLLITLFFFGHHPAFLGLLLLGLGEHLNHIQPFEHIFQWVSGFDVSFSIVIVIGPHSRYHLNLLADGGSAALQSARVQGEQLKYLVQSLIGYQTDALRPLLVLTGNTGAHQYKTLASGERQTRSIPLDAASNGRESSEIRPIFVLRKSEHSQLTARIDGIDRTFLSGNPRFPYSRPGCSPSPRILVTRDAPPVPIFC